MLSGSMHAVFGDEILLVKILKTIIGRLSIKTEQKDDVVNYQNSVAYIKCMIDHGLSDILVQVLRWSFKLLSNKKLQVENRVRFEVCHMSIEHALYIYNIVAEYFFPHRNLVPMNVSAHMRNNSKEPLFHLFIQKPFVHIKIEYL